jgi:hypothetical protein
MNPLVVAMARQYPFALARAKAAGLPMAMSQLAEPMPPADQNAAPLYLQLVQALKDRPLNGRDKVLTDIFSTPMPSAEQLADAKQALADRADLMGLVHQALSRPKCVFPHDWSDPNPEDFLYTELAPMRRASEWLTAQSLVLAQEGKPMDAVANQALIFRFADDADSDKLLIPYLVTIAIQANAVVGFQRILYLTNGDPKVAAAIEAAIEQSYHRPSLSKSLGAENAFGETAVAFLRAKGNEGLDELTGTQYASKNNPNWVYPGSPAWNKFLDANSAFMLQEMTAEVSNADRPYWDVSSLMRIQTSMAQAKNRPERTLAGILMPITDRTIEVRAREHAKVETLRTASAVLVWKGAHGSFPTSLTQAMANPPVDPFDGKPLRYKREGAGFVIYSVGPYGSYKGGSPDQAPLKTDAVFRFPMPNYVAP